MSENSTSTIDIIGVVLAGSAFAWNVFQQFQIARNSSNAVERDSFAQSAQPCIEKVERELETLQKAIEKYMHLGAEVDQQELSFDFGQASRRINKGLNQLTKTLSETLAEDIQSDARLDEISELVQDPANFAAASDLTLHNISKNLNDLSDDFQSEILKALEQKFGK